jgi:hypothetical protein
MADDRDRPRPKKSWREVDQMRGKSRSGERDRDPAPRPGSPAAVAQKSYRAALERAFESGTLAELARTLSRPEEPRAPRPAPAEAPPPAPAAGDAAAPADAAAAAATPAAAAPPLPAPAPVDAAAVAERENRMKLIARIKESEGRDAITRAIDAFFARYPKLPDDFEVLTKALSHKDDERVAAALTAIETLLGREKPRRGRTLQGQLRFLEETHSDPEIRTRAAAVRARL